MLKKLTRRSFVVGASLAACALATTSALADAPAEGGAPEGDAPDGGGAPAGGGMGGGTPLDLTGMLALKQYVFVASQGEVDGGTVSCACYGAYGEGEGVRFAPAAFEGELEAYLDSAKTKPAEGVTAKVEGGTFTLEGADTEGNTAYYLFTSEDAYNTIVYVVNSEYGADSTLTLADGTSLDIYHAAPNMAQGDYTATVEAANEAGAVFIGGNRMIRTAADYGIEGDDAAAVDWFLSSGVTNAGDTYTEFGDVMYGFEYAVAIYRLFQIVCDQVTFAKGYVDATDFSGAMFSNDPYSDSVSATLQVGVWNGIYTKMCDVKDSGATGDYPGFYLLTNIDADTTMLGTGAQVTGKFARVGLYNALQSKWTMKNSAGEDAAGELANIAAEYDQGEVEAPADYTNEAKVYAVAQVLEGTDGKAAVEAMDEPMDKLACIRLLYTVKDYLKSRTAPDAAWAEQVGSYTSDISQFFGPEYGDTTILVKGSTDLPDSFISEKNAAVLIDDVDATVELSGFTVSLTGNADDAANVIVGATDPNTARDGAEAATEGDGLVYNASARNAFYRYGIGSAMPVWGAGTVVKMSNDDGTLVVDGEATGSAYPAGTMAGAVYCGFGAAVNVTNSVAYSSEQHLSNILYNGSYHYIDSAAFGSGRVYSSDFWGGYQVFEDCVATGDCVTDEPTTLIVKNSVYGKSLGGNGFASIYFENSKVNGGCAEFQNTTSLVTDVAAMTVVNSTVDCSGDAFASSSKGERAIVTLVDSSIDMSAGSQLAKVDGYDTVNAISLGSVDPANVDAYQARFNGQLIFKLYGDNTIATPDGTLGATVADGATLTIFGSIVDESGAAIELPGAVYETGEEYGTLTVVKCAEEHAAVETSSQPAAGAPAAEGDAAQGGDAPADGAAPAGDAPADGAAPAGDAPAGDAPAEAPAK